ncbi:hypothetical protein GDO81_014951 [Engystomops pustulosus]|uniref:Uncharacterized protein n=1 Tax=Engystomops pustulosus TaxID=76066 RepID=A0AAV7ALS2_ENGPU|nr:hypothetical protein GDO81_014951 [Engystomops pustulosus]
MLGRIIETLSILLAANLLISEGQAPRPEVVSKNLYSSINVTTSFDPRNVKDITWIRKIEGKEHRIAKIQNGELVDRHGNRYQQFYNGTVLVISHLTEDDLGLYIADVTCLDDIVKQEEFNLTLCGNIACKSPNWYLDNVEKDEKSHDAMDPRTSIIVTRISVLVAAMVVTVIVVAVVYRKTSPPRGDGPLLS